MRLAKLQVLALAGWSGLVDGGLLPHGAASLFFDYNGFLETNGAQTPIGESGQTRKEPQSQSALQAALYAMEMGQAPNANTSAAALQELVQAVSVMQDRFFETWQGTWPAGIDWTRAVMGTQVSGALRTISGASEFSPCGAVAGLQAAKESYAATENRLAQHFSEITAFYFGENALDLRGQAYDDMQWVVLGWLEALRLVNEHSDRHFGEDTPWFAHTFNRGFAHRSRVFWDLAEKGWDEDLCGGGMTWNPRLKPYKNAITNELFVASSIAMYLHFPGDDIDFPFTQARDSMGQPPSRARLPRIHEHDEHYLTMAIKAYDWLYNSGMLNHQGLFTDGFHALPGSTDCDERAEAVFTYNQGVILTGQRGLWEATGNKTYLEDGHRLIRNVIKATGFDKHGNHKSKWAGLGRYGVIEETCDAEGRCSQDGQTFKGVFFHHLAEFCQLLPKHQKDAHFHSVDPQLAKSHLRKCLEYSPWLARNARAAVATKDKHGVIGMWWIPDELLDKDSTVASVDDEKNAHDEDDYRNYGVPRNELWMYPEQLAEREGSAARDPPRGTPPQKPIDSTDLNDRGRGRTPESQGSGIAVIKALYEFVKLTVHTEES